MTEPTTLVVIGGTSGIGREIAERAAGRGETVIISGRQAEHATQVADQIGGKTRGIAVDLAQPAGLAEQLASIDRVDHLVLAAIARDQNTLDSYDFAPAINLVLMKLVGNTQAIHLLRPVMTDDASIVVFGGQAYRIPYPGSTTVSTVNGGVEGLVHSIATQIAPVRINAIHPGIVGDSPAWEGKPQDLLIAQTPLGRLATMSDIADAVEFLLRNRSVNGECLTVNGGRYLR
jgi:NAD(P)-dependent dehydrogenase (short-subunit alcohol dehydrogenase family)